MTTSEGDGRGGPGKRSQASAGPNSKRPARHDACQSSPNLRIGIVTQTRIAAPILRNDLVAGRSAFRSKMSIGESLRQDQLIGRLNGRRLRPAIWWRPAQAVDSGPAPAGQLVVDARKVYAYQPSSSVPAYWHPYEIHEIDGRRRFVQSRLADLRTRPPTPMPAPVSDLLADPAAPAAGPVHQIEPATIPVTGLRLERRYVLGRASDGTPRLWRQRRRLPLLTPPVSGLRFDILEQQAQLS